jgi:hypothetical protein
VRQVDRKIVDFFRHSGSALCVRIFAIVAAFYPTTPINTGSAVDILSAIQPAMFRTLRGVYARLVDWVRVVRHSNEHVISIACVISNAAAFETAVV